MYIIYLQQTTNYFRMICEALACIAADTHISLEPRNMNWTKYFIENRKYTRNIYTISHTRNGIHNNSQQQLLWTTYLYIWRKKKTVLWTTANNMDHAYFWFVLWRKRYRYEVTMHAFWFRIPAPICSVCVRVFLYSSQAHRRKRQTFTP